MRRMNVILGVVLVAQLILAVVLASSGGRMTATTRGALLALDDVSADRIVIANGEAAVELVKTDAGWHVPAKGGFPADAQKVSRLLDALQSLQTRLPVATSKAARERFQVGADTFARRITLKANGERVAKIYFGESAGPGEVYARVAASDAIYEVRFELWSATAKAGDWLDSSYLHRATAQLARIELPQMTLEYKGKAWQLVGLADGQATAVKKTAALVSDLTTVAFAAVIGRQQDMTLPTPTFAYTLVTEGGKRMQYRFHRTTQGGNAKDGDDSAPPWLLTTSASPYVLRISKQEVARLRDVDRSKLILAAGHDGQSEQAMTSTDAASASTAGGQEKDTH